MRIVILSILLLVPLYLISQVQTFVFTYSTPDDDRLWNAFETEDGCFYLLGHIAKPESNKYNGKVIKLSREGELIDESLFDIPDRAFDLYGVLQDTSGSLILFGKSSDTTSDMLHNMLELRRVDYQLNLLDSASFILSEDKSVGLIVGEKGANNNLIFTGGVSFNTPPYGKGFIYLISSSFDSLRFYIYEHGSIFHQIKQLNETTYWDMGWNSGYRVELRDTLFNYINSAPTPKNVAEGYGIKWDTDSSFFMVGEWDNNGKNDIGIIRMFKPIDTTNHLFNSWGLEGIYDYPAPNGALDFLNKDSIYIGAISPFWPWSYNPSHYVIIQTDSLLNIRWERFYGNGEYYYELIKILATSDGGCLLAGTRFNYFSGVKERDIYIVKLDSEGLLVGEQNHNTIQVKEALVFPNPGTNNLKVRIATQYSESIFELYDINGKQMLTKEIHGRWGDINTSLLKPGTYVYRIHNSKGLFETGKWVKQ